MHHDKMGLIDFGINVDPNQIVDLTIALMIILVYT
jgi:hypothetical protein